jgi:hypothetical protein
MKLTPRLTILLCFALLMMVTCYSWVKAQDEGNQWSPPYRLSSGEGSASEASLIADQYGYVHVFWTEELDDNRAIIQYARFDGNIWTTPNDIHITKEFSPVDDISSFVDQQGTLHLLWVQGLNGAIFYSRTQANNATSANNWLKPIRTGILAKRAELKVDSKGVFHVLYARFGEDPGVYYVRSEDQGVTWSEPIWLDPDILPNSNPKNPQFALDTGDGLHAVWNYSSLEEQGSNWVRYARSLDGGDTWSTPFTIDREEGADSSNVSTDPIMAVQGETIHVIWAAGEELYRQHRSSRDRGETWSTPAGIFEGLTGAAGDGLTVDAAGDIHFFGQVRYPQGIYHATWHQDRWSNPTLIYLIRYTAFDAIGNRIHAHATNPVVRAGNQLVLSFTDPPSYANRRLFVMYRTLENVPAQTSVPTPPPTATATPSPTSTMEPENISPTPLLPVLREEIPTDMEMVPSADRALRLGVVPVMLLLGGIVMFQLFFRNKD